MAATCCGWASSRKSSAAAPTPSSANCTAARNSLEITIRDSKVRLGQVIDTIPASISAFDRQGRRVFANRHSTTMLPDAAGPEAPAWQEHDRRILQGDIPMLCFEEEIRGSDGRQRTLLTSKYPLRDAAGTIGHVLTTSFDISERKTAERSLERLAHTDALTGLPNRLRLYSRLVRGAERSARGGVAAWRCTSSTSTSSRPSMTGSATTRATSCCRKWASACGAKSGIPTWWPAWAATSSPSSSTA